MFELKSSIVRKQSTFPTDSGSVPRVAMTGHLRHGWPANRLHVGRLLSNRKIRQLEGVPTAKEASATNKKQQTAELKRLIASLLA